MRKDNTSKDWPHHSMPTQVSHFTLEKDIPLRDYEILKRGYLPKSAKDPWFTYFESRNLYICRSASGFCIYIVSMLPEDRFMQVTVNRDPQQYVVTDIEQDKKLLNDLLDILIRFGGLELQREKIAEEQARYRHQMQKQIENERRATWG